MKIENNQLHLGGMASRELLKKFGSPLYVYEEDIIRNNFRKLKENIRYPDLRIHYACKANTNISILKILREEGAFLDAVSPGEVFIALKAGFSPEMILFTGNNVTESEMKFLIDRKILINIDSFSQLEKYGKLNPNSKVSIRINPDVGAGHHEHTITGGPKSKFGIYYTQVEEIKKIANKYRLKIAGIHMHIGSGILDPEPFLLGMKTLLKTAEEFDNLEFVDFGGGLGVPYKPEEKPLNMKEFGKKVGTLFNDWCKKYGKELALAIEPGRFLVAESGVLLTTVNTFKVTPHRTFIGTDSGFNHLVRPAMYGSYHEIIVANKPKDEKTETYDIAGNICESGDLFARDRKLPKIREGDILAILTAGAYGFSMASNYNSRPFPAEVLVKDGTARLIRKRQAFDDLLKGQN